MGEAEHFRWTQDCTRQSTVTHKLSVSSLFVSCLFVADRASNVMLNGEFLTNQFVYILWNEDKLV